ncbi:hypothetical protein BP6252_09163 [Coleophoma cylindrospora]|uniref:L-ornithine N(5)-oxygenase n=1 Tax=Coleophoma cylindrospora TaxID=1849047 RepID=A0A3D8R155_9HELO|nr:hypothetical protein BP6252_09163 [Coleophoma cylindrospora]
MSTLLSTCSRWAGLVAAKTYLEVDPSINLTIIDADSTIGGVWGRDRIYPGLVCDSPVGFFEYSDLAMGPEIGLKDCDDLPAAKVYDYMHKYCKKFSLLERTRLNTTVTNITRDSESQEWKVEIKPSGETVTCDKLLVATGLASIPHWPNIPMDTFTGPVMHSRDIGKRHTELISEKVKRVTVLGGCKSALDAAMACSAAGKTVDWVIRAPGDGNGPGMMVQVRKGGKHAAALMGRWKSFISPSVFSTAGFWYNFWHSGQNRFGFWLRSKMWETMGRAPFGMEPYKTKSENMSKLLPEIDSSLWQTAAVNALHGNEWFLAKLHEGKDVHVHRASITSLTGSEAVLSNGTILPCDAAVLATGWKYSTSMFEPSLALTLGVPTQVEFEDPAEAKYWQALTLKAEHKLQEKYPVLKTAPDFHKRELEHTPFRLYKHIIPHTYAAQRDRSLIFLGMLSNLQFTMYAEVSALWGISWMEGLLDDGAVPSSKAQIDGEIAEFNSWSAQRYLSRGRTRMVAGGEIQDVIDLLMQDLGLPVHRRKSWIRENFVPYRSLDYKGIVQDVLRKGVV